MNLKITISNLIILSTLILNVDAMSRKTAKILTAATTTAATGLVGYNLFNYVKSQNEAVDYFKKRFNETDFHPVDHSYYERSVERAEKEKLKRIIKDSLVIAAVAVLSKGIFFMYTSKGLLKRAKYKHNNYIKIRSLVSSTNFDKDRFLKNLKSSYIKHSCPLPEAFKDFNELDNISKKIVELLQQSKNISDVEEEVKNEADELLKEYGPEFFDNLKEAILAIRENPNFIEQQQTNNMKEIADATKRNAAANQANAVANTFNAFRR